MLWQRAQLRMRGRHAREVTGGGARPAGRLARFAKPALTAEQREAADVAATHAHFIACGWDAIELYSGSADGHLGALLERAKALQEFEAARELMPPEQRRIAAPPAFM
jgi:hypothetical protein